MDQSVYLKEDSDMWIVVSRHCRDNGHGIVLYIGLTEERAKAIAKNINDYHGKMHLYNYWAMPEKCYFKPFSG